MAQEEAMVKVYVNSISNSTLIDATQVQHWWYLHSRPFSVVEGHHLGNLLSEKEKSILKDSSVITNRAMISVVIPRIAI